MIGLIIVMFSIIIGSVVLYRRSVGPYNQAKQEASVIAQREADLVNVEEFYWYNGSETYFSLIGDNEEGEGIVVIIRQEGGQVMTFPLDEVYPETDAIRQVINEKSPERILQARIGIEEESPVWEVSYRNESGRIGYYIMDLETGEWIRTIDNI